MGKCAVELETFAAFHQQVIVYGFIHESTYHSTTTLEAAGWNFAIHDLLQFGQRQGFEDRIFIDEPFSHFLWCDPT